MINNYLLETCHDKLSEINYYPFKRRVKSHLPSTGIIRSRHIVHVSKVRVKKIVDLVGLSHVQCDKLVIYYFDKQ